MLMSTGQRIACFDNCQLNKNQIKDIAMVIVVRTVTTPKVCFLIDGLPNVLNYEAPLEHSSGAGDTFSSLLKRKKSK